ncbi:hypothetical protein A5731_22750 [Mycolicibacterium conceptionense]|uniref:Uncharacterized protein n=1 Tax=Mycolicibacterium conceptionense TaxID=451644 RepID=A0A1A1X7C9_9MYCO|nr:MULTISPECIES: hypothetical protein [Mycolicibacterium]MCW1820800.1 hypothetical protein [Mycolicibacterium senegalense]OBB10705.1 hypothetical protein A5718_07790 [Mycolicibacterium conceptionense]OBE98517.1 hypothetical protein A5731_22750 [Mycolicibacterium conceptionense]OBF15048.1 hypothetical protein A5726_22990 [Mycolicibacterium conceptionense]OBF30619.1 hypothetical protein A5720_29695 [Mycolicibacterium conceptionense]
MNDPLITVAEDIAIGKIAGTLAEGMTKLVCNVDDGPECEAACQRLQALWDTLNQQFGEERVWDLLIDVFKEEQDQSTSSIWSW